MFNIALKGEVKFDDGMLTKLDHVKVTVEKPENEIWLEGADVRWFLVKSSI